MFFSSINDNAMENLTLTRYVRYEIVGRLCLTTSLKATAVRNKVMVTANLSADPGSMENVEKAKVTIIN